jgi:hypothetical protein
MNPLSPFFRVVLMVVFFIGILPYSLLNHGGCARAQTSAQVTIDPAIPELIRRQQYNEAITRIEQVLEREPSNAAALTYMATANLYLKQRFVESQKEFEEAFKAGGGATFFVFHSHEKFTMDDLVDYCRGWLHLRRDGIEFVPSEGSHGFKLQFSEIKEFQRNRLSKRLFHIKAGEKTYNFRGRSNTEFEPLLIIALYKSFTKN